MSKNGMVIELWDIDRLVPYEKNAKKHPPEQIRDLARSIAKNGWTQPFLVEADGTIVGGHGRRLAALSLIETNLIARKVPVVVFQGTKDEADAQRIADNTLTSRAYDVGMMQDEIQRLFAIDDSLVMEIGLSEKELAFVQDEPLHVMDESLFVEDIQGAVEEQREANDKAAKAVDAATAPVGDAFGFKRLTVAQSQRVRAFMTQLEAESGKKGADALMVFLDNAGVAA